MMLMRIRNSSLIFVTLLIVFWINAKSIGASGKFGFDIHHRYSDSVKDFLDFDGLPEKGSLDYYAAMAHRDKFFKARRLAQSATDSNSFLTFFSGNQTYHLPSLGFLHYAIVHVGTPRLRFIVALDTGSDLFWLPCECAECARSVNITTGTKLDLNIYSLNSSSSSRPVSCNSPMCGRRRRCSLNFNACAYQEIYLSANTSSTGILVDDVLHLITDDNQSQRVEAPITLGCGIIQTGHFLEAAAPNGLFGLGMDNISVPSILASKGLASNSFSLCFGSNGLGRIEFGDKGSQDQKSTPFIVDQLFPTYNITVTQIIVGRNVTNLEFTAIFDSGTSFTYLNDPAYSAIADTFNSQITDEPRYIPDAKIIFEYCYQLSANQTTYSIPVLNFTMKGGDQYYITDSTTVIPRRGGGYAYCLAIVKSEDINIIGQNFMSGYRLVFDREEMVLGWKQSKCTGNDSPDSNVPPVNKPNNAPPPSVFDPVATSNRTRSSVPPPPPSPPPSRSIFGNSAASSRRTKFLMPTLPILFITFFFL